MTKESNSTDRPPQRPTSAPGNARWRSRLAEQGLFGSLASGRVDAAGTYLLQVASLGLGFLSQLVVARLAGISGYGTYSYALAWSAMVVQPSLLGLDRVLIRELATYRQAR